MLDMQTLTAIQKKGEQRLSSLRHDEDLILESYALVLSRTVRTYGKQKNEPFENIILNACRLGIALGLGIDVTDGAVYQRPGQ